MRFPDFLLPCIRRKLMVTGCAGVLVLFQFQENFILFHNKVCYSNR